MYIPKHVRAFFRIASAYLSGRQKLVSGFGIHRMLFFCIFYFGTYPVYEGWMFAASEDTQAFEKRGVGRKGGGCMIPRFLDGR